MTTRGTRPHYALKPCSHCGGPHGPEFCLSHDFDAEARRLEAFRTRAAAHSLAETGLRAAQRWQNRVTDLDVAAVLYMLEAGGGEGPYRIRSGRWVMANGVKVNRLMHDLSTVIGEMIRTGLVRHVIDYGVDYLVPALVHLCGEDGYSACHFTGEDLGPMRARLVNELSLVDCLECEAAIARGHARGL